MMFGYFLVSRFVHLAPKDFPRVYVINSFRFLIMFFHWENYFQLLAPVWDHVKIDSLHFPPNKTIHLTYFNAVVILKLLTCRCEGSFIKIYLLHCKTWYSLRTLPHTQMVTKRLHILGPLDSGNTFFHTKAVRLITVRT